MYITTLRVLECMPIYIKPTIYTHNRTNFTVKHTDSTIHKDIITKWTLYRTS